MAYSYLLVHKRTGKKYYGIRWTNKDNGDLLGVKYFSSSKHVQKIIKEEGRDSFEYHVRVRGKSKEYVLKLEEKVLRLLALRNRDEWLNKGFNSNGLLKCFGRPTRHTIENSILKNQKPFVFYKDGVRIEGINIEKFARENALDADSLSSVLRGKAVSYNGYTSNPYNTPHRQRKEHFKEYTMYDINSNEVIIKDIVSFCVEHDLKLHSMKNVLAGKVRHHKGYRINKETPLSHGASRSYEFTLNGNTIQIDNLTKYCKEMGINRCNMKDLISGKLKQWNGYRFVRYVTGKSSLVQISVSCNDSLHSTSHGTPLA